MNESSKIYLYRLKSNLAEYQEQEKAKWEALPEEEKQKILAERELLEKQKEFDRQAEERRKQIDSWKHRGVTKRYFEAKWNNFIADTPEKEKAINAAKTAWSKNLFFTGSNGTGKTHLAMCLAKDGAIYRRLPDIFREVRSSYSLHGGDSEEEVLDYCGACELLIIDEIGRQKFSDFEMNLFFDIIDRRWNNVLPTTIITNLTWEDFTELYGTAILDRLRPVEVRFDWESMRGKA